MRPCSSGVLSAIANSAYVSATTPMLNDADVMARRIALTPLRRVGKPDEVAGVAVLLASRAGAFITGQNIVVDGGTLIGDGN